MNEDLADLKISNREDLNIHRIKAEYYLEDCDGAESQRSLAVFLNNLATCYVTYGGDWRTAQVLCESASVLSEKSGHLETRC